MVGAEARPMDQAQRVTFAIAWLLCFTFLGRISYVVLGIAAALVLLLVFRESRRAREHAAWLAFLNLWLQTPLLSLGFGLFDFLAQPQESLGWLPGGTGLWFGLIILTVILWGFDAFFTFIANAALAAYGYRPFRGIVPSAVLRLTRGRRKPVQPGPGA